MSVDNSELLMLLGGKKKAEQTIGIAGQQGFGVGVYGGDPADLKAMGLKPMSGCFNPASNNYGNYIHTNGSVMVFIPTFAIRIGNTNAPLYSKYGDNTIEIGDVELNGKDGWAIPRGFYDGDKLHQGFFIDKYLCSKDSTGTLAVSVKNKDPISMNTKDEPSSSMPNCVGQLLDAITLGRARGEHYALVSCFQWAVISLVSLAHAQNATSVKSCAWYDAGGLTNYPKGNNANTTSANKDVDDKSISFTNATYSGLYSKTGSAVPLEKTTHNGQPSGICDVNGNKDQLVLGWQHYFENYFDGARPSVKMHDFTKDNLTNGSLFYTYTIYNITDNGWTPWKSTALFTTDADQFPMCGVLPAPSPPSPQNLGYFGGDQVLTRVDYDNRRALSVAGSYSTGTLSGVWHRYASDPWTASNSYYGFRAAGYPP